MTHTMTINRRHIAITAAALLGTMLTAGSAVANPAHWPELNKDMPAMSQSFTPQIRNQVPKWVQRKISASDAKAIARRRVPGEVVDVSKRGNTYVVRIIRKDGRRVDVLIDATTGRVKN